MEETNSTVVVSILAYSVAAVLSGILVVLKEEFHGLFEFMKSIPPLYHTANMYVSQVIIIVAQLIFNTLL